MPTGMERIPEQRLQKLANIRAMGIDPYPPRYSRTHTARQAVELLAQAEQSGKIETEEVTVAGRVMANRSMGKISFLDVQDGSGKIQLFLGKNQLDEQSNALLKEIDIGDFVGAKGVVFRTKSGEAYNSHKNTDDAVKITAAAARKMARLERCRTALPAALPGPDFQ